MMEMINFDVKEYERYSIVEIKIPEVISVGEVKTMDFPDVNFMKGVIISGRAPIWLYGILIHYFHPADWVAVFDPRLGKAIVVMSHDINYRYGDLVEIEKGGDIK